jgi:predicted ATPase/class 3 adenylate cyclase
MADHPDRALIEAAIAAQGQLRETLGDDIVDATIEALRAQLQFVSPDSSIEHERRLVTVLFMDVVDSTRILRGIDPEETMTIMDAALQTLAEPIHTCGGRVTRFMGDGFLAVFGIRRTRENDAEMAVRAGLMVLDLAQAVAVDVTHTHNIDGFQVRVGINTGLVVTGGVTEAQDTIMGSTVNLASRIESAAPPGGLLISQSTYRQLRGRFDLEPAGTIDAKGFPEPIPVHLVKGERSDSVKTRGLEELHVEMVGRSIELRTLIETFEHVVTTSTGHVVTVTGDAGIGKSRLLTEFESHLVGRSSVDVFRARAALQNTDVPHALFRDLVERRFGIRRDDPVDVVRGKLENGLGTHLADGPTKAAKIAIIGQFLGYIMSGEARLTPQQLRDRAVAHLVEFFRAAAQHPLLLLFDDMQWADDSSLDVLRTIAEELTDCPVLIIALTRPEGRHPILERFSGSDPLSLGPLSTRESESLVDQILSRIEDCPPELRTRLLEYSGGNPYYLEELVMMCIDDGVIVADGPVWYARRDRLATLKVPTTLAGVVRARLDGLPPLEHEVLQQASVVGRIFWNEAVARIAGEPKATMVDTHLRSLVARQMIGLRSPSTFSHASEYAFSHSLVRDATYEEVLLSARREYHAIVADWLIAVSGDREGEFVGPIAGHLEKAGRSAEALDYLTRAAEAAFESYAVTTAADFYDRALALVPDNDWERQYQVLLGREKTSALQGDRDAQRRELDQLERIVNEIGEPTKQALVAIERSYLDFYTGDYKDALTSALRAAEHATSADDSALRSQAQTALAWATYYLGDWVAARSHGQEALALARQEEQSQATAENLLGMIALATGELSEARSRLEHALDITDESADSDAKAAYLNNLAVVLTMIGDYQRAYDHFSAVLEGAIENGDRQSESSATVNLAWVASATGAWETALQHAERGLSMKRQQEHREGEAEALLWLGHTLLGLGRLDEACEAYEESLTIRNELDQTALGLAARSGLIRAALARGNPDTAMSVADDMLAYLDSGESLESTWEPLRIHLAVYRALDAIHDDRSVDVLRRAYELLTAGAEKISDSDDRKSYLAIPWHKEIGELAGGLPG